MALVNKGVLRLTPPPLNVAVKAAVGSATRSAVRGLARALRMAARATGPGGSDGDGGGGGEDAEEMGGLLGGQGGRGMEQLGVWQERGKAGGGGGRFSRGLKGVGDRLAAWAEGEGAHRATAGALTHLLEMLRLANACNGDQLNPWLKNRRYIFVISRNVLV